MRSTLTISLPPDILGSLKRKAKKAGMTVSAYVRRLVVHEKNLISEEELLERSRDAMRNYRRGKVKILRSLDDLDP